MWLFIPTCYHADTLKSFLCFYWTFFQNSKMKNNSFHEEFSFPGGTLVNNPLANPGDTGSNLGLQRSSGEGNKLRIFAWEIPWTEKTGGLHTVHGVTESNMIEWLNKNLLKRQEAIPLLQTQRPQESNSFRMEGLIQFLFIYDFPNCYLWNKLRSHPVINAAQG